MKNKEKAWKYERDTHEEHVREGRLWWGLKGENTVPALKLFLSEVRDGMTPHNWWPHWEPGKIQRGRQTRRAAAHDDAILHVRCPDQAAARRNPRAATAQLMIMGTPEQSLPFVARLTLRIVRWANWLSPLRSSLLRVEGVELLRLVLCSGVIALGILALFGVCRSFPGMVRVMRHRAVLFWVLQVLPGLFLRPFGPGLLRVDGKFFTRIKLLMEFPDQLGLFPNCLVGGFVLRHRFRPFSVARLEGLKPS